MDFVIQWLCYLAAFVAGSAVGGVIITVAMRRATGQSDSVDASGPGVGVRR